MTSTEILVYLRSEGHKIGDKARGGDQTAMDVMHYYEMVYRCPDDDMAWVLLEKSIEAYKELGARD